MENKLETSKNYIEYLKKELRNTDFSSKKTLEISDKIIKEEDEVRKLEKEIHEREEDIEDLENIILTNIILIKNDSKRAS